MHDSLNRNPYNSQADGHGHELAEAWQEGFEAGKDTGLDALLAEAIAIEYHPGGEVKRLEFPPSTPAVAQAEAAVDALRTHGEASLGDWRCTPINDGSPHA